MHAVVGHPAQQTVGLLLDLRQGRLDDQRLDSAAPERGGQLLVDALLLDRPCQRRPLLRKAALELVQKLKVSPGAAKLLPQIIAARRRRPATLLLIGQRLGGLGQAGDRPQQLVRLLFEAGRFLRPALDLSHRLFELKPLLWQQALRLFQQAAPFLERPQLAVLGSGVVVRCPVVADRFDPCQQVIKLPPLVRSVFVGGQAGLDLCKLRSERRQLAGGLRGLLPRAVQRGHSGLERWPLRLEPGLQRLRLPARLLFLVPDSLQLGLVGHVPALLGLALLSIVLQDVAALVCAQLGAAQWTDALALLQAVHIGPQLLHLFSELVVGGLSIGALGHQALGLLTVESKRALHLLQSPEGNLRRFELAGRLVQSVGRRRELLDSRAQPPLRRRQLGSLLLDRQVELGPALAQLQRVARRDVQPLFPLLCRPHPLVSIGNGRGLGGDAFVLRHSFCQVVDGRAPAPDLILDAGGPPLNLGEAFLRQVQGLLLRAKELDRPVDRGQLLLGYSEVPLDRRQPGLALLPAAHVAGHLFDGLLRDLALAAALAGLFPGPLLQPVVVAQVENLGQHLFALVRRLEGEFVGPPLDQKGAVDEGLIVHAQLMNDPSLGLPHGVAGDGPELFTG